MRRLLALFLVLPLLTVAAAEVDDPFSPGEEQWGFVQGTIELPTRFIDGESGWPGLGRRVWLCSADTNGTIAYIFDVYAPSWGGPFVIDDVTDQTGEADLDVYFYEEFGDCGGGAAPTTVGEFDSPEPGEFGFVPQGARKAVVFTANGVQSSFTYSAWSPPVIELGVEALDLTVHPGATVVWENQTDDYAYVRHTPESGAPEFDSSPGTGTGIPVGATFSHRFSKAGVYTYVTPVGTGTITVTAGS